ncbi:MAG: hypothetical protein RLZZ455_937 [Candidatus Parcubacteria bacterium]|jgi:GDP-4-dehydro-6-deoxy-D-mannose reductase
MKKALITGISGFAGSFLARLLLQEGQYEVAGTYHSEKGLENIADIREKIQLSQVDLTDTNLTESVVSKVRPDSIFHLAALASPVQSFKDPSFTFTTNITGQINLLESVRKLRLMNTKLLIVSSAEVYGIVDEQDLPIDESTNMRPVSPYAVSKITQDYLGLQYFLTYKQPIVRVRPFNHIGPGQKTAYAVSAFAQQIAAIEKGQQPPVLYVGNLTARRDFTDVRDIVRAYVMLLEKGVPGEVYNIGSGVSYPMSEVLEKLIALSSVKITIEQQESRFMPVDIPDNRCDNTKLKTQTGWGQTVSLDSSLRDVLDYWRKIT